jgi:P-type Mg2+ transporter
LRRGPWLRRGEVPFDFERRCVSVLVGEGDKQILIVKGAPEAILSRSTFLEIDGQATRPIDATTLGALDELQNKQVVARLPSARRRNQDHSG